MKVKYVVLGLAAVSLLAAGCNKQATTQNNAPASNTEQTSDQMSSSTGDDMMMNGTSTDGNMMMATGTNDSMMMNGTSTMMASSSDEMMQK